MSWPPWKRSEYATPTASMDAFHANVTELQVRSLTRGSPGTVGGTVSAARSDVVHAWFVCRLQVHMMTSVPLAVPRPVTSRHRPDCTPTMLPSARSVHFWFAPPL